jgi:hypothetical protein
MKGTKKNGLSSLGVVITFFALYFFPLWPGGYLAAAQELFKFTGPKTETEDIKVRRESLTILPRSVPLMDLRFENVFAVDPSKGRYAEITYTLPEPAFVKFRVLRAGTRELFLASIVDFEYREAGTHTEVWDGRDYWGNLVDYSKTPYFILHWTESESISTSPSGTIPKPVEYKEGESQQKVVEKANFPGRHIHFMHPRETENVPLLTVITPTPNQVLRGKVIVKASVDKKRRGMADKYGYGVRYYIDDQLLHEEFYKPESGGEFSYQLDTTALDNGKHLLYVGLCDHNDHVTSYGLEVLVEN